MRVLFVTNEQDHFDLMSRFAARFEFDPTDRILLACVKEDVFPLDTRAVKKGRKRISGSRKRGSKPPPPPPVFTEIKLPDATPDSAISLASEEHNVDLVVLGLCGIEINSLITHNTIRSVVSNTRKPVFVIRSDLCKQVNTIKILFATDGSLSADTTGMFLSSIPFRLKTEVAVLNVINAEPDDMPGFSPDIRTLGPDSNKISEREQGESLEIIRKSLSFFGNRFNRKKGISRYGDPTVVTLQEADKMKPDIIAVGYRGSLMIDKIPGTMPRNLLRYSQSCLLIGKIPQ